MRVAVLFDSTGKVRGVFASGERAREHALNEGYADVRLEWWTVDLPEVGPLAIPEELEPS